MDLTADERAELEAVISVGYDRSVASRARMILDYAAGITVSEIVASSGATKPTFYKWVARYGQSGIAGLADHKSPGRPRVVTEEERARIIALTKLPPPESSCLTHWTSSEMASYLKRHEGIDVSHTFVSELWRENGLKPRRDGTFKVAKDPGLSAKAVGMAGLFLDPPSGAVILSFDEGAQFQPPERAQPALPVSSGRTGNRAHGYMRHGTASLFAALEALYGQVPPTRVPRQRTAGLLKFMDEISSSFPEEKEMHVILHGAGGHGGEDVETWLAQHPSFAFHYMPTESSWISQVENWFGIITWQAIRRGSFKQLAKLINAINDFVLHWNQDAGPFAWTAATGGTLEKTVILDQDYEKLVADIRQ